MVEKDTFWVTLVRVFIGYILRIETVQDLEFDESYNYEEIRTTAVEEPFFSFPKLELFTNNTYNTPVREEEELPAIPPIPSITYLEVEDDNSDCFFFTFLNDNTPPLQRSSRICHEPIR